MKAIEPFPQAADTIETDEFFETANLFPRTTGLPMTVWVSPRRNACHNVRIKANMSHGDQMTLENTAVVAVRPALRIIEGRPSAHDERAVFAWIELNRAALIAYWDGDIDTAQLAQALQTLSARP